MVIRVPLPLSERQTQKQLVHPGQPLLGEAVDGLKLQVIVQQDGTAVESSRSDPGSRQEEGMGGPDLGCADQQGLAGFQPVDRPAGAGCWSSPRSSAIRFARSRRLQRELQVVHAAGFQRP